MDVNECYQVVLFATAKNKSQGYVSPDDFNLIINQASRSYANFLLGGFNYYTPGRPISKVELGQNSNVRQRLTPIIYGYNLNIDVSGFSPYPNDFLNVDAIWSYYGYNRIRYAAQEKLYSIYNSTLDPIATNPIYLIEDVGFRFYPQSTATARLNYVKNPPDMIWGYTEDVNGRPVYSAAHSTQPVWDDASMLEVIVRALAIIGVNLQLNVVMGYAQTIKTQGQ